MSVKVLLLAAVAIAAMSVVSFASAQTVVGLCSSIKNQADCLSSVEGDGDTCLWCKCSAVPSICANSTFASKLPHSVFSCSNTTRVGTTHMLKAGVQKLYLTPSEQMLISLAEKIAGERLPYLTQCANEVEAAFDDFKNFANHLHLHVADVETALKSLAAGLSLFKKATIDCHVSDVSTKLAAFVKKVDSIIGDIVIATDIIIDGLNIYDDLHAAVVAFEHQDYATCGRDIGEAIELIMGKH